MKRRENIKLLIAGGLGASLVGQASCKPSTEAESSAKSVAPSIYGRTEEEAKHDAKVMAEKFFTDHEMKTVRSLSDIIIPKDEVSGSATDAGVPEFIEFMMNDQPSNQLPMRGGLRWLDNQCINRYANTFVDCKPTEQTAMLDLIAYPDKASPDMKPGVKFFNMMRNMVATGFFTSKMGVKDIGYIGNTPNEWDGVPKEVLDKYGLAYEEKYAKIYVDPATRNEMMIWEES